MNKSISGRSAKTEKSSFIFIQGVLFGSLGGLVGLIILMSFKKSPLSDFGDAVFALKENYILVIISVIFGVVVTMGITLGALLCVLTLGYVILFKPLPYPEQNALYNVRQVATTDKGQQIGFSFSYPGLIDFYRSQKAFSETVLTYYDKGILVNHAKQPTVSMTYVTPEWVSFFAPPMLLGRNFEQSEKLNTSSRVVVISYSSWQQLYNADPEIIGKIVAFRDHRYKVIGVTAKDFLEPHLYQNGWQTQFWLPWDFNPVRPEQRQLWQSGIDGVRVVGKQVKAPPTNVEISALSVAN